MDELPKKDELYRHYKGNMYRVVCLAKHSETLEDLVVYCSVEDESKVWCRPLTMFMETIEKDGKKIERFEKVQK